MSLIDWIILTSTISFIVIYGVWKNERHKNLYGYIKGSNTARWWTVGLSVMATQASAITFLSTPGQAFHDGMGFVQFYFGLPFAMIIICVFFIPIYNSNMQLNREDLLKAYKIMNTIRQYFSVFFF